MRKEELKKRLQALEQVHGDKGVLLTMWTPDEDQMVTATLKQHEKRARIFQEKQMKDGGVA